MTQFALPRIAARLFNTELLVDARKAAAILAAIGGRFSPDGLSLSGIEPVQHVAFANGRPSLGIVGDPVGRAYERAGAGDRLLPVINGVGIIAIEGSLVHKGGWIGSYSGETSYQGIQAQVARARRDDSIRAVAFEIDSYGGEAAGAFTTADAIVQLSAEKPTVAILTDVALSGGYLLAAACRQIVAPPTGSAGSIGVIGMHVDLSARIEADGEKVTLITSGTCKADGNPFEPLPDDVRAKWQARMDAGRNLFATYVGKGRGDRFNKAQAMATEAEVFPAADAKKLGMIDAIGNPNDVFENFVRVMNRRTT